jgi:2,4-dienoyl-CoA reductase-like NADH-dependent reductase (Old Yellow Enzyme family)/pyruvate/2-oxoglutarate dehydrogenase complex dihydrolipoamide dehydrogenase (E3) component
MSTEFAHLARPLQLRHLTLRNRIVFGAHTANMSEDGLPGARHLGYYRERARGGAAMIVVEPVPVHAAAVLTRGNFLHSTDDVVPGFRAITDAVHDEGAAIIQQLYHVGQHGDSDNSYHAAWSPSGLPSYHDADGSHEMTAAEIEESIQAYVDAALRAQRCGFDGVELFAAYHALIDQFWLPWSNRRTDEWGGEFDHRMRFGREIMERIRTRAGDDFVIGLAVSIDPGVEVALDIDTLCEIVAWHDERRLMDYVTCGTGSYFSFDKIIPSFTYADKLGVEYAERLTAVVTHAKVQAESHVRTPENADYVIASGQADMVSIVRGQIADPYLAKKAIEGRADEVRGCISCNQMCWGRRYRDYWISCLVNPSAGREFEWGGDTFHRVERPRAVLVVGGGPGGLETARVAAERGHHVTLMEAAPLLGGAFRLAGLQPRRSQITELIEWYARELERLDVQVEVNHPMFADDILAFGADAVVMATGSQPTGTGFQRPLPLVAVLPGAHLANVHSVEDVMSHRARPGSRVVLVDDLGDWRGLGTAWFLAERGHQVVIVTPHPLVGFNIQRTNADYAVRAKLAQLGTTWHTDAVVTEWTGTHAVVRSLLDGHETSAVGDALVLATTNAPEDTVLRDLGDRHADVRAVGDVVAARLAVHAIYDGRVAGMAL